MLARWIELCATRRWFVAFGVGALALWGAWALRTTPLDALPDLSDTQVIVFTEWMGRSPDLVEDQVTYPIVTTLLAAPKVKRVRGFTMFGMSFVYVIFEDGTDLYWARSRVLEYLAQLQGRLPAGVAPAARARRDGRRLGVPVRARRRDRQARPPELRIVPGLAPALLARLSPRRRRGRERRRLREAVPGRDRPRAAAGLRALDRRRGRAIRSRTPTSAGA